MLRQNENVSPKATFRYPIMIYIYIYIYMYIFFFVAHPLLFGPPKGYTIAVSILFSINNHNIL